MVLIGGFIFLLLMLYIGSRFGGVGLGAISGLGLAIQVFIFRYTPSSPPISVMLIIIAVVVAASVLEAGGGLLYMLQLAERALRKNPKYVTFLAPFTTYLMTFALGTGHAVYAVMPIIGDVALKNKIRPERPMAAASVASQIAITASPISAAVVFYVDSMSNIDSSITLISILTITIPATLSGIFALSIYSFFRGKDLDKDPEYQKRLKNENFRKQIEENSASVLHITIPKSAKIVLLIFILSILSIVFLALFPSVRTVNNLEKPLSMSIVIQIVMLCSSGLMLIIGKVSSKEVMNKSMVFKSGFVAVIAIFGIAWMSDTYFSMAIPEVKDQLSVMIEKAPWTFAIAMFIVSVMINSQAATAKIILPVGISLGLPPVLLIGLMPSVYGYFFIPNYPSDIATCNFDLSETTKIGKYYFNHSFMIPGLIGVTVACVVGYSIASFVI